MDEPNKYEKKQLKKEEREQEKDAVKQKYNTKKTITYVGIAVVVIIIIASVAFVLYKQSTAPGQYDDFAKCLNNKNIKIYGTDACHNCQNQKRKFGKSFKYIDYTECNNNPKTCLNLDIEAYPTWVFGDGSRHVGVLELEELADKSGCNL